MGLSPWHLKPLRLNSCWGQWGIERLNESPQHPEGIPHASLPPVPAAAFDPLCFPTQLSPAGHNRVPAHANRYRGRFRLPDSWAHSCRDSCFQTCGAWASQWLTHVGWKSSAQRSHFSKMILLKNHVKAYFFFIVTKRITANSVHSLGCTSARRQSRCKKCHHTIAGGDKFVVGRSVCEQSRSVGHIPPARIGAKPRWLPHAGNRGSACEISQAAVTLVTFRENLEDGWVIILSEHPLS